MTRLPTITDDLLDDEQRKLWETVNGGRRAASHQTTGGLIDSTGGLIGPFNGWLHSPVVGLPAAQLGESVRYDNSLDRDVLELAIVTVAIHWRSEFEYWAHRGYALAAGIPAEVIDRLQGDANYEPSIPRYAIIVRACRELLASGTLGDATFRDLIDEVNHRSIVDLITTVGYYTLVSFNLNAFQVALPEGVTPVWS